MWSWNSVKAFLFQHQKVFIPLGVLTFYLVIRLFRLTALPVFADEAIYLRWAQLIRHNPQQYLYFALNDGKPPLFIWSLAGILNLGLDPLWAARLISVVVGAFQLIISDQIIRKLGGNWQARIAQLLILLITPFWFFHQRMGLMDAMLVLWLSLSWLGVLILDQKITLKKTPPFQRVVPAILLSGVGWGLALWTKIPALFFAGVIFGWAYFGTVFVFPISKKMLPGYLQRTIAFGLVGVLGLAIFALLKLQPAFGSLFGRGSDFTFSVQDILGGEWRTSISNLGRFFQWMSTYLRPEVMTLPFIAALISKKRSFHWRILISAAIMALPLIIMGKTVHPRYYLPVAPFITVSAALFVQEAWFAVKKAEDTLFTLTFWLLILSFLIGSLRFVFLSYFTPDQTPFVLHD